MHVTFDLSLAVRGHARLFGYSLSITELIIANSHFPEYSSGHFESSPSSVDA